MTRQLGFPLFLKMNRKSIMQTNMLVVLLFLPTLIKAKTLFFYLCAGFFTFLLKKLIGDKLLNDLRLDLN